MSVKKWISREEEAAIPMFSNHNEAIKWFEEKYGEDFKLSDVETIDGEDMFFCVYIVDRETYKKMQEYMRKNNSGLIPSNDETEGFINSYQPIQISSDGSIHIVH